ncbi:MAG: ATP-binding protein [Candidatus Methanomethylophilus sp.]|jgi:AAA15 family ATPase/GTPase|nr:ATP-binding protein [Methanomethylophilus sp.]MCI2074999.1 ATP-binding protein [Methanomethylophilus sp.]
MLISFSVTNFKLFKDTATLDMTATADRKLIENVMDAGMKRGILRTASVYGANASGKTTLFRAMEMFRDFVMLSPTHMDNVRLNYAPFALDPTCAHRPTRFDTAWVIGGVRYAYSFSYDSERIAEESLFYYPNGRKTKVFEREGQEFSFGSDKRFREGNARRVKEKVLFLSVSAQFNDRVCENLYNQISSGLMIMCGYDQALSLDILTDSMSKDERFRKLVLKAFKIADFGITDVFDSSKKKNPGPPQGNRGFPFLAIQNLRVKHSVNGKTVEFPIASESSGTVRFMSVIGPVVSALINGWTLVIDEIDMSFHTDVCQWIVGLFLDPAENRHGAQLIFNTHEVGLLDQGIVRRDQVWFTVRDWDTGASDLRRLSDYRVRNNTDIRKAYLNGSFGAKPFIAPERLMK